MASEYVRFTDWQTRLESLGHAVGLVIVAFLLGFLLAAISGQLLRAMGISISSATTPPPIVLVVVFAAQFTGFAVAVFAYLEWRNDRSFFRIAIPSAEDLGWMVGGFVGLFVVAAVIGYVIQFLGAETATNQTVKMGRKDPTLFLYLIPVTILFVAPAEELLFRGVVQGLFRRAYGVVPGVILASAVFGVGHYLALTGGGKLTYIAVAGGLGIVLGSVYEFSENLAVPIAIHGAWNAFLFGTQYLVATGAIGAGG